VSAQTYWLASYPKSGNTWVRAVHAAASTGADVDINDLPGRRVPATRAVLDAALCLSTSDLTAAEVEVLRPRADEMLDEVPGGSALRKVHDAFVVGATGEPVVSVAAALGAVYVVRDPRDVAVSLAHHGGHPPHRVAATMCDPAAVLGGPPGGIGFQVEQRIGCWSEHVASWVDQSRLSVHVLRYEDAVADPVAAFGPMLRFAGLELTDGEVAAAVDRTSFRVLAGQEAERGFRERIRPDARFFRRGQPGAWRDELPAALAERLVRHHREVMIRFGYSD
jgi:aryl sulfotransferase